MSRDEYVYTRITFDTLCSWGMQLVAPTWKPDGYVAKKKWKWYYKSTKRFKQVTPPASWQNAEAAMSSQKRDIIMFLWRHHYYRHHQAVSSSSPWKGFSDKVLGKLQHFGVINVLSPTFYSLFKPASFFFSFPTLFFTSKQITRNCTTYHMWYAKKKLQ